MTCLHKNNSSNVDSISLCQFDYESGKKFDYQEPNFIKTRYNNPPNSPTRKNSVLTLAPSCHPNRPLTSLPHLISKKFQSIPLVTVTPAPERLKNPIPIEATLRKFSQGPSYSAFSAFENTAKIKRPKSSLIPGIYKNNSTIVDSISNIVDSISLYQFDPQSGKNFDRPEKNSITNLYF
jgi:hypothetical protein